MTRINIGIPPAALCDKHLLSEHREITRVRHAQRSKHLAPERFKLGKGHVLFFKNKLGYIFMRYAQIHKECVRRKFDVKYSPGLFMGYDITGTYKPTVTDIKIITNRLKERLATMKNPRYYGKPIEVKTLMRMLDNYKKLQ